jgi:hypothetical protein
MKKQKILIKIILVSICEKLKFFKFILVENKLHPHPIKRSLLTN